MTESNLILVVEDDDTLRLLATKQLSKLGYSAQGLSDGKAAVECVVEAQHRYGLILMDVQMPKMDGIEATIAIRLMEKQQQSRRVPIIAMTANPDRDTCLNAGMDDFIFKPVMLNQLMELLNRWNTLTQSQAGPNRSSGAA